MSIKSVCMLAFVHVCGGACKVCACMCENMYRWACVWMRL